LLVYCEGPFKRNLVQIVFDWLLVKHEKASTSRTNETKKIILSGSLNSYLLLIDFNLKLTDFNLFGVKLKHVKYFFVF